MEILIILGLVFGGAIIFGIIKGLNTTPEEFKAQQRAEVAKKYKVRPTSTSPQEVVEYKSYDDFETDRQAWLTAGWKIATISDSPQRPA